MGKRQGLELWQHGFVLAQGLQDDVTVGMVVRFFGGEYALFF
jgi:hypothetical protein